MDGANTASKERKRQRQQQQKQQQRLQRLQKRKPMGRSPWRERRVRLVRTCVHLHTCVGALVYSVCVSVVLHTNFLFLAAARCLYQCR